MIKTIEELQKWLFSKEHLNSILKSFEMLRRPGIVFTKEQIKQIKEFCNND